MAVFVAVALLIVGIAVSSSLKRRGWVEGRAEVISADLDHMGNDVSSDSRWKVTARLTTREGQSVTGPSDGFAGGEAKAWEGTTRKAWYDPKDPRRFTLIPPLRERGIGSDDMVVWLGGGAIVLVGVVILVTKL